jgi:hypothetical protein
MDGQTGTPQGKERRDWTKMRALIYLLTIREQHGTDALVGAQEVAAGARSNINSLRVLLKRWSQRNWTNYIKDKETGAYKVLNHKGMGFVEEYDITAQGSGFRFGYRITDKGVNYLNYCSIKKKWYYPAHDEVLRATAIRIGYWDEQLAKSIYINPPFSFKDVELHNSPVIGQLYNNLASREQVFDEACKCKQPPSKEFWQAFFGYTDDERASAKAAGKPLVPNPLPKKPEVVPDPVPAVPKPHLLKIDPKGILRFEERQHNHGQQ